MIFFTGDTHFGDPRGIRIDKRPFVSVTEQDAALVANWNAIVGRDDDVWHLGDFARGDQALVESLLARLNGRKHLIIGNNDPAATLEAEGWASMQHYAELRLDTHHLILCHYAFRTWNGMGKKSINLHGHSHGRLKPLPRQVDVGVDAQAFKPVTLDGILSGKRWASLNAADTRARRSAPAAFRRGS